MFWVTGCTAIALGTAAVGAVQHEGTVDVAAFGAVPDDGQDDTAAFLEAFAEVARTGAQRLVLHPLLDGR